MASAIPVPGQPGRLWLPGVGVINQYQEGNMKISSFGGLGQMRVALSPALAARAAAAKSGDVVLRTANPVAQAAFDQQQRTMQLNKIKAMSTDMLVEFFKAGLKNEGFDDAYPQQVQAAMSDVANELRARGIDPASITVGFNWKSPMVLGGGAAVVLLGGFWWYKRRR